MKANELLFREVSKDRKTVVITAKGEAEFRVLGSSLPISLHIARRATLVDSVTVDLSDLESGQKGVIAVVVSNWAQSGRKGSAVIRTFLLDFSGGNTPISLDASFVSAPDRLGQIVEYGRHIPDYSLSDKTFALEVTSGSQVFTTRRDVPGTFYVDNGDLLCQFLVGKIELDDLKAVAQEYAAEKSVLVQLCDQLEKVLARFVQPDQIAEAVQSQVEKDQREIERLKNELKTANQAAEKCRKICEAFEEQNTTWRKAAMALYNAVCSSWFGRRARIRAALQQFRDEVFADE